MDHPCLDDELVALATLHGLKVLLYGNQDYRGAILFQAPDRIWCHGKWQTGLSLTSWCGPSDWDQEAVAVIKEWYDHGCPI